jgi:colanic acid/amylovoran biosynthesis glycosyltransferase
LPQANHMPREVGIYRRIFPKASETFIHEQAQSLTRYRPTFILNTLLREIPFPTVALSANDQFRVKQALFLLTRSPRLFTAMKGLEGLSLIHAHFGPDGVYAMPLAEHLGLPLVVTFHGYDITLNRTSPWPLYSPLYGQLLLHEHQLKTKAAGFIAVSRFIQQRLLAQGYPEHKIIQHYIGVDTTRFKPSAHPAPERYILCVGRHTAKKGIATLLKAFARIASQHPSVQLLQVGAGKLTEQLQELTRTLGISEQVRFLGALPHEQVLRLMQGATIFALPSEQAQNGDSEALGIVFNEASACGVPVVSTRHGGIPEAVRDGETGFLVAERDDQALAARLDLLLSDPIMARSMGARGRDFVCAHFDLHKQAQELEAIYDRLTLQPSPALEKVTNPLR